MPHIDSPAQPKPGYYLFEVPGKSASVYLSLDVIDRLQQEVMRGFGAVPKRGAEVGGFLLGSAKQNGRLIIEIEDYEVAPIEYKRGPSYQLSPPDFESLSGSLERLRAATDSNLKPVGFFRSHTRDAAGLVDDDITLLDRFFPDPNALVLLIKPYATRVSTATFFFRENGAFPTEPPQVEFPFRRKDLAPGDESFASRVSAIGRSAPQLVPNPEAGHADARRRSPDLSLLPFDETHPLDPQASESEDSPPRVVAEAEKARSGWVWLPLSFIFLLLGVLLGFQAAITLRPQTAGGADPFNLQLTVAREGDNLNVRWDRQALAVRSARRGVLVIADGAYRKTVELDPNQLQTGSVVYRHSSSDVAFRLEVYPRDRDMITESIQWKQ